MKKNDITYEYRVFTNRRIDIEAMEVGKCTSKVIKDLKPKDKVDGRFFHTSDTDEWFFCWNGELQKLNLKGDSDVNAALAEVEKLIGEANAAVNDAKATAKDAKAAAVEAKAAADSASAAVESIENKADKTVVDELAVSVANKADADVVNTLSQTITEKADKSELDSKADASVVKELSNKVADIDLTDYAKKSDIPSTEGLASEEFVISQGYAKTSDIPSLDGYLTKTEADSIYAKIGSGSSDGVDISGKQDIITDLDEIRAGANLGKTALQEIPSEYVTEDELSKKGYLTEHQDITGKQDVIEDIETIRSGAALGATAVQSLAGYATEEFVTSKGYVTTAQLEAKQNVITDLDEIRANASNAIKEIPSEYVTETELSDKGYATESFVNDEIAKIQIPTVPENVSEFVNDANYLTLEDADLRYAPIGGDGVDLSSYATKDFVGEEINKLNIPTKVSELENDSNYLTEHQDISGKQDVISDLETIRSGAALGATAIQSLAGYATEEFVNNKIGEINIPEIPSMDNYYTKEEIDGKLSVINDLIGQAEEITNKILA